MCLEKKVNLSLQICFFFLIVCLFEYTGINELVNNSFFYEIFGGGLACLFALVVRLLIFQKTV